MVVPTHVSEVRVHRGPMSGNPNPQQYVMHGGAHPRERGAGASWASVR